MYNGFEDIDFWQTKNRCIYKKQGSASINAGLISKMKSKKAVGLITKYQNFFRI